MIKQSESEVLNSERLRLERERLGYKVGEFAELVGTTRQTQTKYEKLERKPDIDYLAKAATLGMDIYFVITGTRSHLETDHKIKDSQHYSEKSISYGKRDLESKVGSLDPTSKLKVGSENVTDNDHLSDEFTLIPLFNVSASAGNGSLIGYEEETDSLIFRKDWIHNELHSNPANLYLVYVEGESMEPALRPGDLILVDHTDNAARRDAIYLIRMGDSLLVKRIQRLPNKTIKVSSDNPAYDSFEISLDADLSDEFAVIGRVVWSGRRH